MNHKCGRPDTISSGLTLLLSVLIRLWPLSALAAGGCICTSSLIQTANNQTPRWDQHQQIASAWRTPAGDLLLLCEGKLDGGAKESYRITLPGTALNKQAFAKFDPEGLGYTLSWTVDFAFVNRRVLTRGWPRMPTTAPDWQPVPVIRPDPPLRVYDPLPALPPGASEAVCVGSVSEKPGDAFVYLADHPIWGEQLAMRFAISPRERWDNRWMLVLTPATVVADIVMTPCLVCSLLDGMGARPLDPPQRSAPNETDRVR
jgi:hypothetical protein